MECNTILQNEMLIPHMHNPAFSPQTIPQMIPELNGLGVPVQIGGCVMTGSVLAISAMAGDQDDDSDSENETGVATKTKARPKKPSQYKVLMLNDDYTPMEFVVMVLKQFFSMDLEQATRVMLHVHQRGVGVCGIFPYEVAETKVNQVMDFARENQHPLQCTLEKA